MRPICAVRPLDLLLAMENNTRLQGIHTDSIHILEHQTIFAVEDQLVYVMLFVFFQKGYAARHIGFLFEVEQVILHMDPVGRFDLTEFVPDYIHTFAVTLFSRLLHIIVEKGIIGLHGEAILRR